MLALGTCALTCPDIFSNCHSHPLLSPLSSALVKMQRQLPQSFWVIFFLFSVSTYWLSDESSQQEGANQMCFSGKLEFSIPVLQKQISGDEKDSIT